MELLQPGQRMGAYRIIRQLGAGGMGQVYEAEHVALGVRRALKVFSTESEHSEFLRKRFVAEGRILADLQHPRIVRVYDLVVDEESGTAYFEMDLVLSPNGQPRTLADEQRDGLDEGKVASWFKDICEGLAYIHSQGIVHRDMSLDNILIGPDGHAVITDFGIAKIIDDSYRKKIDVTVTMVAKDGAELRMGKGLYMAPELKEQGGKATFASDAYAVGVILFRLLSGSWYDVGTHLEDWLADFEYEWHPIISQLCNADPEKRLGEGGISSLSGTLRKRETNDDAKKNRSIWVEVLYDLFRYLYLTLSIVTVGLLPMHTAVFFWIKYLDFKKGLRRTIGLLFGWRAILGLLLLFLIGIPFVGIGNIITSVVSAVVFFNVSLALRYIKKANADESVAWRIFNLAQWVEFVILGIYPLVFIVIVSVIKPRSGLLKTDSLILCFILISLLYSLSLAGLKSFVTNKIRWAYRMDMVLLFLFVLSFLIFMISGSLYFLGCTDLKFLIAFTLLFYLVSPMAPISFCLGAFKGVRNRFADGKGCLSVRWNLFLKIWYFFLCVDIYLIFMVYIVFGSIKVPHKKSYTGDGVTTNYMKAVDRYCKAAEQGDAKAQYNLGLCYYHGEGVNTNYTKAVEWYRKAIVNGSFDAIGGIGTMYEHGRGVTNNPHTAYLMYLVAAANGVSNAVQDVIRCYENGIGVEKNLIEAKRWIIREVMNPAEHKAKDVKSKQSEPADDLRKKLVSSKLIQVGEFTYQYGIMTNGTVCIYTCGQYDLPKGRKLATGKQESFRYFLSSKSLGRSLKIPNTIESKPIEVIEVWAFQKHTDLISVILPASLKVVKLGAFAKCKSLEDVSLPEGLSEIGDYAFFKCERLRDVVLPHSVTNIGAAAFYPTPPIVPEDHPHFTFKDGALYTKDYSVLVGYYGTNKVFAVDSRTKKIGSCAFYGHPSLKTLLLPDGLQEIGEYSLSGCSHIRNLRVPFSVSSIGKKAFQGCYDLEVIRYEGRKPKIGEDIYEEYIAVLSLVKQNMGWEDEYGMLPISWPEKWDEVSMSSDKRERSKTCFPVCYWKGDENFSDKELTELYISALKSQAEAGNVTAMSILGARYRGGWGGVKKDEEKALQYLQGSALGGNVEDMGKIGCLYRNGINGKRNYTAAAKWFNRAISEGGRWSCWVCQEFAPMYRDGHGVEKDPEVAYLLWLIAASHGMAWAQCEVAGCYERGIGIDKDIEEAKYWYRKALAWKRYEGTSQYEWRLKGAVQHAERKLRELGVGKGGKE